jgi:hypothetical protein
MLIALAFGLVLTVTAASVCSALDAWAQTWPR